MTRERQSGWRGELYASASALESMNGATEKDFLAITEKLAGFRSAARTISGSARELADTLGGQNGGGAWRFLLELRDAATRMAAHVNPAAELERIRDSVSLIRRSMAGFESVGPSFQVIATLAQRESAHIGTDGMELGQLVSDFRSAGGSIRSHVEGVLNAAAVLERRIESALHDAAIFNDRFSTKLPALIAAAEDGLAQFRIQQEQTVENTANLARGSDAAASAIADIATSIQFHDITRQQIEHVIDALKQLSAASSEESDTDLPPPEAVAGLDLQLAQLANSRAAFMEAVEQMDQRLVTLAARIRATAADAGALLGPKGRRKVSFYARLASCFHDIGNAGADCRNLERKTASALDEVRQSLAGLEGATGAIDVVESRLKRLAINAVISAGHIGVTGEPLRALAMEMLKLVKDCESSSGEVEAAIAAVAASVRAAVENSRNPDIEAMNVLFDQLHGEVDDLRKLEEAAGARSGELERLAAGLCADMEALRRGISAGRVFTGAVDACSAALRRVLATADSATGAIRREHLIAFQHRYTMHAEREVHAALLRPEATAGAANTAIPPGSGGEFGENVELF